MSPLQPEASIWYVACWVVVVARFVSKRLRLGSWKYLQVDDYLVLLAMMTLTVLMSLLHIIIHTSSNLIEPGEDVSRFTPEEIAERIYGSKLTIVAEQMQITTIWLLKTCILIMYSRIVGLLELQLAVKGVAVYVGISFIVMEVLWFAVWCRPFDQYYAVPTNSTQCSAMVHHLITNAVLNISSDLMIMAIPIPLVVKVKLPIGKKLILGGMFFIGVITIFAAAYNKYKSFKYPFSPAWILWYLREAFTAMLCANLPLTRPVIQRLFNVGPWTERPSAPSRYATSGLGSEFRLHGDPSSQNSSPKNSTVAIENFPLPKPPPVIPPSPSEEPAPVARRPLEIMYTTDITIEHHPAESDTSSSDISFLVLQREDDDQQQKDSDAISTKSRPRSVITTCYHLRDE